MEGMYVHICWCINIITWGGAPAICKKWSNVDTSTFVRFTERRHMANKTGFFYGETSWYLCDSALKLYLLFKLTTLQRWLRSGQSFVSPCLLNLAVGMGQYIIPTRIIYPDHFCDFNQSTSSRVLTHSNFCAPVQMQWSRRCRCNVQQL